MWNRVIMRPLMSRLLAISVAAPVAAALVVSCSAGVPAADSSRMSSANGVEQGFDLDAFRAQQRAGHDRAYAEMTRGEVGSCWGGQEAGDPAADPGFSYRADCEELHRSEIAGIVSFQPKHRVIGDVYVEADLSDMRERCRSLLGDSSPHDVGGNHVGLVGAIAPLSEEWNTAVDNGQPLDVRCTWYYSPMQASVPNS